MSGSTIKRGCLLFLILFCLVFFTMSILLDSPSFYFNIAMISPIVCSLLQDHPYIYPYPSRFVTNISHLSSLLKNLNVVRSEGGTTRVALHQVPITFVYRNSLDSHELMPFPVSLVRFPLCQ